MPVNGWARCQWNPMACKQTNPHLRSGYARPPLSAYKNTEPPACSTFAIDRDGAWMDSASDSVVFAVPALLLFVAACCVWRRELRHLPPALFACLSDIVRRRRQLQHAAHTTYSETALDSVLVIHSSFADPRGNSTPSLVRARDETQPRSTAIRPHQLLIAAPGLHPSPRQLHGGAVSVPETAKSRLSSSECVTGRLPWLSACNRLERGETLYAPVQESSCDNGHGEPSELIMVTFTARTP